MRVRFMRKVLLALVCLGMATPVFADSFAVGDVFASIGNGQVTRFSAAGVPLETFTVGTGFTTGSAFDASGKLYVTNFSENVVYTVTNDAVHTVGTFGVQPPGTASVESIVFDASGNVYVGHAGGNADITKFDATGAVLANYDAADDNIGTDWIDLAADQTTMFYTSEGRAIQRFDVGSNTQLANFATLSGTGNAFALRLLGDGGLLVADNGNVKRLNSSGAEIQSYDIAGVDGWFSLNLDPNLTSFWSGSFANGNLYEFDIATGALQQTIATGSGSLFGVSVFGEVTQGGPPTTVPEPGMLALLSLGLLGLAGAGRHRKLRQR